MVTISLLNESIVLLRLPANAEMKAYTIIFVFQTVALHHFQSTFPNSNSIRIFQWTNSHYLWRCHLNSHLI